MWTWSNPVKVHFGAGALGDVAKVLGGRGYALVTYPDAVFRDLRSRLEQLAGPPEFVVDDVAPNPDRRLLADQAAQFSRRNVETILAVGGGSVIDSAKVFAAARGDFDSVWRFLETGAGGFDPVPIIAVPTTAGTGSEVTCWATVWDETAGRKYSLALPGLYPEIAIVDPELMLAKPRGLTLATGLDALSHALESIWNINANPVSARFAQTAAAEIINTLPQLLDDLENLDLRSRMAQAALFAGFAFSNTKTALAHNISYPLTLEYGVQHGIACSFTLPTILHSLSDIDGFRQQALQSIFGDDLMAGAGHLRDFLGGLGVKVDVGGYGVEPDAWERIVTDAFAGERGRNFIGSRNRFDASARELKIAI